MVQKSMVWYGVYATFWCGTVLSAMVWYGVQWYMVWHGMVQKSMVWYGKVWNGMVM